MSRATVIATIEAYNLFRVMQHVEIIGQDMLFIDVRKLSR